METHKLTDENAKISFQLSNEIAALIDSFCEEHSVQDLGVVAMAVTSVMIGAIMGSIPPEHWAESTKLIAGNIEKAMQKLTEAPAGSLAN